MSRSLTNSMVNVVVAWIAYCHQPKQPSFDRHVSPPQSTSVHALGLLRWIEI